MKALLEAFADQLAESETFQQFVGVDNPADARDKINIDKCHLSIHAAHELYTSAFIQIDDIDFHISALGNDIEIPIAIKEM